MSLEPLLILPVASCVSAGVFIYKGIQNQRKMKVGQHLYYQHMHFLQGYELNRTCGLQLIYPLDRYDRYGSVGPINTRSRRNVYIPFKMDGVRVNLISLQERNRRAMLP